MPSPILSLPKQYRDGSEDAPKYKLKPAKDGSRDLIAEAPTFIARITPNGDVHFEDRPRSLTLDPAWLPTPMRPGTETLESYLSRKLKRLPPPPGKNGKTKLKEPQSVIPHMTRFRPDPQEDCEQHPRPCHLGLKPQLLNVTGKFDVTDELLRLHGNDPYRLERARFLAETRELRIAMAVKSHAEDLRTQQLKLPDMLRAIACDDHRTLEDRMAILEALQSEMDTETSEGKFAVAQIRAFRARWTASRDGVDMCP